MNKTIFNYAFITLCIVTMLTSCSKDDDNNSASASKTVTYEISGNFSMRLDVFLSSVSTTGSGSGDEEIEVTSLPWSKTIEYPDNTITVAYAVGSTELTSIPGEFITIKIKVDGVTVQERSATVNSNELLPIISISHIFKQ